MRTIQSPGVEIKEIDLSLRPVLPVGTAVLVTGFAPQGPTDEVFEVTSFSEFEQVYGKPTNAAERYFYHTARAAFNSDARILAARLPYGSNLGEGFGEGYSALFYPVVGMSYKATFAADVVATPSEVSFSWGPGLTANAGHQDKLFVSTNANTITPGTSAGLVVPTVLRSDSLSASNHGYVFGKPVHVELTKNQYNALHEGNFTWQDAANAGTSFSSTSTTWGHAGLIITNKSQTTINDKFEGYYVGLADNYNFNPATDFDAINGVRSVNANSKLTSTYVNVPASRMVFALSAATTDAQAEGSVSEVMEGIPTFDMAPTTDANGTSIDKFKDSLVLAVFKLRSSVFSSDVLKLDYVLSETYVGSLDETRKIQNPNGGGDQTFFLGEVEDSSPNIELFVNPSISRLAGSWTSEASEEPTKFARVMTDDAQRTVFSPTVKTTTVAMAAGDHAVPYYGGDVTFGGLLSAAVVDGQLNPLGYHAPAYSGSADVGSVPTKIRRILNVVENVDAIDVDVTTEGGLGTIYTASRNAAGADGKLFDDTAYMTLGEATGTGGGDNTGMFQLHQNSQIVSPYREIVDDYRAVFNEFHQFAEFRRKDHVFIADPIRHIFVQGEKFQVMDDKRRTFTQHVYWPLKHLYGAANNSFSIAYGNWGKVLDGYSGKQIWVPMSGTIGATFANSDSIYAPWYAPAGFTRGRLSGINRLAVIPKQKNRDQLYRININPVTQFPNEGMVIFGQKTMFKMPSAFDRINVRRLFLYLERVVRKTMKFFIFEPNTFLTRSRVIDTLTPVFENVKNNEGMYDYLIICDDRNNTPDVIDQNELVVDIYIKPVRAAEFILVNFYATRTGQDFSELVS
jgi:hypothetical protein